MCDYLLLSEVFIAVSAAFPCEDSLGSLKLILFTSVIQ